MTHSTWYAVPGVRPVIVDVSEVNGLPKVTNWSVPANAKSTCTVCSTVSYNRVIASPAAERRWGELDELTMLW